LSALNNDNKITFLSQEDSDKIDAEIEKRFIRVKKEYLAQEREARLSRKSPLII
jgi:hypothetical protein